ncbi:MAG: hypothetical protein CVU57_20135 [Deltaproteobacteria bacterium HGW-Deltaproteobacteria-15]|jgi:putative ABC transport system permease protein|nr:MAG: hypothetical protein CVU57_20135 [Deltaproteobacteria bacterium HGW-Deltaproteobacteria-15]
MGVPVAWKNVCQNKKRTLAAASGISFALLLVFMQLGFLQGAKTAAASVFELFHFDIVIVSEKYKFVGAPDSFDRMRLTQTMVVPEVEASAGMTMGRGTWTDPESESGSQLLLFSVPLDPSFIKDPAIRSGLETIRKNNTVMVDLYSHKEYGDLSIGREVEVNDLPVTIASHFKLGVTLFSDGCVIVSKDGYDRLTKEPPRMTSYGFLRLRPGSDSEAVKKRVREILPDDVLIFTRQEMIRQEQEYFISVKPIGIIFQTGVVVAFIVGVVILFQVLNTDISNRLKEFATFKAMGFKNGMIYGIGIEQALIYVLLSYFPSLILATIVYRIVHRLSRMPMNMTFSLASFVLVMSLVMCAISCVLGLQKVRRADPAELF